MPVSIFTRPDSPPPRAPSPDIVHNPLPSPYLRPRLPSSSSSQQSLPAYAPLTPPGLIPFARAPKSLLTVRSCDHLAASHAREPRRTRSNLVHSSPPSSPAVPRALPLLAASHSIDLAPHRRCLSNAVPYRSPPPSPTRSSAPPPVPPIPPFILTSSPSLKSANSSPSSPITPIRLAELDSLSPLFDATNAPVKKGSASPSQRSRSMGMTCLKFFSLRNSKRRHISVA